MWEELDGLKQIYCEVCGEETDAASDIRNCDETRSSRDAALHAVSTVLEHFRGCDEIMNYHGFSGHRYWKQGEQNEAGVLALLYNSPDTAGLVRKAIALESVCVEEEIQALQSAMDRALDERQPSSLGGRGAASGNVPPQPCSSPQRQGNVSRLRQRLSSSLEAAHGGTVSSVEGHVPSGLGSPAEATALMNKASVFLKSRSVPHLHQNPAAASASTKRVALAQVHREDLGSSAADSAAAVAGGAGGSQRTFRNKLRAAKDENYLI